jgi:hypothetical protein
MAEQIERVQGHLTTRANSSDVVHSRLVIEMLRDMRSSVQQTDTFTIPQETEAPPDVISVPDTMTPAEAVGEADRIYGQLAVGSNVMVVSVIPEIMQDDKKYIDRKTRVAEFFASLLASSSRNDGGSMVHTVAEPVPIPPEVKSLKEAVLDQTAEDVEYLHLYDDSPKPLTVVAVLPDHHFNQFNRPE